MSWHGADYAEDGENKIEMLQEEFWDHMNAYLEEQREDRIRFQD